MAIELKVPEVGESITEVMIGTWKKGEGDAVKIDDPIVEIESDKATVELPAPAAGTITKVLKASGDKAVVGEVIGYLEPAAAGAAAPAPASAPQSPVVDVRRTEGRTVIGSVQAAPAAQPARVMPAAARVLGRGDWERFVQAAEILELPDNWRRIAEAMAHRPPTQGE